MKLRWKWIEGEKTLCYSTNGAEWRPVESDPKPDELEPPEPVVDPEEDWPNSATAVVRKTTRSARKGKKGK